MAQNIKTFLILLAFWGAFSIPNAYATSALNASGALSGAVYASGSFGLDLNALRPDVLSAAIQYRPSAAHTICSVDVAARTNATTTPPILSMNVYRTGLTLATSSSNYLDDGTFIQAAATSWQVTSTDVNYQILTFPLSPCLNVQGGYWYQFVFTSTGNTYTGLTLEMADSNLSATQTYTGTDTVVFGRARKSSAGADVGTPSYSSQPNSCISGTNYLCLNYVMNGTQFYGNFTASSTTSYSPTNCTPPNSILDVGGGVSYALCYMFVPNPAQLSQFADLNALLATKIPFAYVYSVENAFNNITLNATSSLPIISIPLSSVASSTLTGVIPNLTISTTTISTYFPDSIRLPLKTLLTGVIWLGAGWVLFGLAMSIFRP